MRNIFWIVSFSGACGAAIVSHDYLLAALCSILIAGLSWKIENKTKDRIITIEQLEEAVRTIKHCPEIKRRVMGILA